jgi:hypothetical protein
MAVESLTARLNRLLKKSPMAEGRTSGAKTRKLSMM